VRSFLPRPSASRRPLAVRSTLLAVGVALLASALASTLFTLALHDTVGSGLITFAIFGGLAALSAGVLGQLHQIEHLDHPTLRDGRGRALVGGGDDLVPVLVAHVARGEQLGLRVPGGGLRRHAAGCDRHPPARLLR